MSGVIESRVINYARQYIDERDISAVTAALHSDYLTQGPRVSEFEAQLGTYCDVPHAVAMNSATSALHVACLALGIGHGDWVWTSAMTFAASANCARLCGAQVDFVDIDFASGNIDLEALRIKLQQSQHRPKLIIPVHYAGLSCDMQGLAALAEEFGFAIVEDASHALGATYKGDPVGNCRHSQAAVFSFHPVKMITSGEGGALVTRDKNLAAKARQLACHGMERNKENFIEAEADPWWMEQQQLGLNYRMSDIHAALALSQLKKLDEFVARRRAMVAHYRDELADLPLQMPPESAEACWHLCAIKLGKNRRAVYQNLKQQGIACQVHYIPVYWHPYYREQGFKRGHCPQSENFYAQQLSIPLFIGLDTKQTQVVQQLREACKQCN